MDSNPRMKRPRLGGGYPERRFLRMIRLLTMAALSLAAGLPLVALADFPDWNALTEVRTIEVQTFDDDGASRTTPVWFVLLNGEAYLRTSDSRWLANLRRDPKLELKIEGRSYEAQAEEIPGRAIIEKVDIASQRKYGLQERLIHVFRLSDPQILRIVPREAREE